MSFSVSACPDSSRSLVVNIKCNCCFLPQAYSIEVCRPEQQALGISIVGSNSAYKSITLPHDITIAYHELSFIHSSNLGQHSMGNGSYNWPSNWGLPSTGISQKIISLNNLDYFSPFMSLIYYQPVKQYPHLFHEKSVFGRYAFGLKLNYFNTKIE